ncbi:MAG: hypothetical protein KIT84_38320 [Labilithrix sp.]|nr:hypothetical protein [Labilithrix sp.]
MSDGPKAEPLDEIILGEDDATPIAPPPPKASQPPPLRSKPPEKGSIPPHFPPPSQKRSSQRVRAAADVGQGGDGDRDSQARKRAKMTLRIPDDEVARPADEITIPLVSKSSSNDTMSGSPPQLNADDTLELPSDELRARSAAALGEVVQPQAQPAAPPAPGVDPSHEPGWTPQQPQVDPGVIQPTPIVEVKGSMSPAQDFPSSEEIPVAVDLGLVNDDVATSPKLPTSEEIRIDDGDRVSVIETGEVEINADDLMSVDSLPIPPPVKTAGKYPAYRSDAPSPPQTATAMMANAPAPVAVPSQPPPPPPAAASAPVVAPPVVVPPPPMAIAPAAPAPSSRSSRRRRAPRWRRAGRRRPRSRPREPARSRRRR